MQILKLLLAIALFIAFVIVAILKTVEVYYIAYYRLFAPLKAEELTVWAEVPARADEKTFDQKDYHIQYAENEHKYQWTIGGSEPQ